MDAAALMLPLLYEKTKHTKMEWFLAIKRKQNEKRKLLHNVRLAALFFFPGFFFFSFRFTAINFHFWTTLPGYWKSSPFTTHTPIPSKKKITHVRLELMFDCNWKTPRTCSAQASVFASLSVRKDPLPAKWCCAVCCGEWYKKEGCY